MPNRETWLEHAQAHRGHLVVWIEQAADAGLKQANSQGVCHAIVKAWIDAYMQFTEDRSMFVNSFREYNADGLRVREAIPQDFLDQQGIYQAQVEAYNSSLAMVRQLAPSLSGVEGRARLQKLIAGTRRLQRDLYGNQARVERPDAGTSIVQVVRDLPVHPCYVMLSMRTGHGGHVVGFEFRPDVHVSSNFYELYEFLDANLGLFAFSSRSDMLAFFLEKVWSLVYADRYAGCTFQIAVFPVALAGVGFGTDVSLEQEYAALGGGGGDAVAADVRTQGAEITELQVGGRWLTVPAMRETVLGAADEIAADGVQELLARRDFPTEMFPSLPLYRRPTPMMRSNTRLLGHFFDVLAGPDLGPRLALAKRVLFLRYIHYIASQIYFDRRFRDVWVWPA